MSLDGLKDCHTENAIVCILFHLQILPLHPNPYYHLHLMDQTQIDFYNSLPPDGKYILIVAAIIADDVSSYYFPDLLMRKRKITNKQILAILESSFQNGLLTRANPRDFRATPELLIYLTPKLADYSLEYAEISQRPSYYYRNNSSQRNLRDFLYTLLFTPKKYVEAERKFLEFGFDQIHSSMAGLLDNEDYRDFLPLIGYSIISRLVKNKINSGLANLQPIANIEKSIEDLKASGTLQNQASLPSLKVEIPFFKGHFHKALELNKWEVANFNIMAITFLTNGNLKSALANFDKGLKAQRAIVRGTQLPVLPHEAFYYLVALLCTKPEETSETFQKIRSSLGKRSFGTSESFFKPVIEYYFNDKSSLFISEKSLVDTIKSENQDYYNLLRFLILYMINAKPDNMVMAKALQSTKKAWENGYCLLALESAFVLKQWYDSLETDALYEKMLGNFEFLPVLSQITRQDEWEKALNSFLSIGSAKSGTSGKDEQGKYRVVYYVNFNNLTIQPVLQTRTAKGWSSGRNIALKTFYAGKTEGMTEQDYRVAKNVKYHSSYYGGDEYSLPDDTIKELVGHPYVFLAASNDLLVELIDAKPVLQVLKTSKGYTLTTDIKDTSKEIIVEKETNTRYKVYDLSSQQITVIEAIRQQKIVVPDQGKEKLMQVLGNFSAYFTVHSDLSVSESTKVRKVASDSRIRVQLLPLGDGLKAELFAKPFGAHPPYCKPGKGGKTLIANQKGEQLQVLRNLDQETEFANALMDQIQSLETVDISNDLIAFGDPLDSLHLLDILAAHQDKCIVEWPEGERYKIKGTVNFGNLNLKIKSQTNWFELQGEMKIDEGTVFTLQQLMLLTEKSHSRFIELKNGEFLALSAKLKKQLDELRTFSTTSKDGLQINKFASVALGDFFEDVENLKGDKSWKEFQKRLDSVQNTETQVPQNLLAELRPYQEEGFRWMSRLAEWEAGACLADDMGLGKTIQALAILLHRAHVGPALVISPVSVIPNWLSETAKFTPSLNVKTLTTGNREQTMKNLEPGDLLITSYGLLQSEEKAFAETLFATIVLDEAHTIKNYTTKTSKAAMQLQASFRVALTGTPIQNHLGEVWNLFNFINPGLLGSLSHFTDTFIKPENDNARKHLKKLIAPFILRRTKSSVLDELPAKTEIVRKVELSAEEMAFYEALRRQAIANLENDDSTQGAKHLKALAEITRLRQACCNPALVNPEINISSTKLSTFLEIVSELIENKHKALVFSQFVTHLSIVRKALDNLGISYQYLDGSCTMPDREKSVKKFQGGEGDLFLISLKAGGLGLNLTAADYVIHLDPWWNPAVEDQASDRSHRIGQLRPVTIYRLVAQNTIEEKIIQLHNTKRNLADSLLEGSDQSAKLSMAELVSLIKDRD